jgi:acetolactate decarboxylase
LLILDGQSFVAKVQSDSSMVVEESFQVKAPFFVYANQTDWDTLTLPNTIRTLSQLETYLNETTQNVKRPFVFRLKGPIQQAAIHIQNLPAGTKVSSPAEAHQGQVNYSLSKQQVDMVGFYSTGHKGVFTHHDSNMHLHLISADRKQMGHLDSLVIDSGAMRLLLPQPGK